jgi:hypothetical protein
MQNHSECALNLCVKLPSRVIDVGPPDGSVEPRLLVLNKETFGVYIALSHSWGSAQSLTMTTQTIDQYQRHIKFSELPQSFKDAVRVTRALGYRYLWIDSLCIIQDNRADWEREGSVMSRIYKSAVLTISATSAQNSLEGFLGHKNVDFESRCAVNFNDDSYEKMYLTWPCAALDEWSRKDVTGTRGWTLQELILAPRVIHYTKTRFGAARGMLWECHRESIQEDGAKIVGGGHADLAQLKGILGRHKQTEPRHQAPITSYDIWLYIVVEYSRRSLTRESDKLPAIAGLAAEVEALTGDEYLAGLWEQEFVRQLLWVAKRTSFLTRTTNYRAPSWSWASVNGLIFYKHVLHISDFSRARNQQYASDHPQFTLNLIKVNIEILGDNRFGAIESAVAIVSGYIKPAIFDHARMTRDMSYLFYNDYRFHATNAEEELEQTREIIEQILRFRAIPELYDPLGPQFLLHRLVCDINILLHEVDFEVESETLKQLLQNTMEENLYSLKCVLESVIAIESWQADNHIRLRSIQAKQPRIRLDIREKFEVPQICNDHFLNILFHIIRRYDYFRNVLALIEFERFSDVVYRDGVYSDQAYSAMREPRQSDVIDEEEEMDQCLERHIQLPDLRNSIARKCDVSLLPLTAAEVIDKKLVVELDPLTNPRDYEKVHQRIRKDIEDDFYVGEADIPGKIRFDESIPPKESQVWCLQIVKDGWLNNSITEQCVPHGLVLIPTSNPNEYRRVGVFELHPDHMSWFDDICEKQVLKIV